MHKFRVGQRVVLVPAPNCLEEYIGLVTAIKELKPARWGVPDYRLEFSRAGRHLRALETSLKPLYDGDEPASWETCAWRPKEIVLAPSS